MDKQKYNIIQDPVYGFRKLDPVPEHKEVELFYKDSYYELIKKGERAPDIHRLEVGGEEATYEKRWLRNTLYSDIYYVLNQYSPDKRVLDVGCGTGDLLCYLRDKGFSTVGFEPSLEASEVARSKGLTVYNSSIEELAEYDKAGERIEFDSITFKDVFEHLEDPLLMLSFAKGLLAENGIICLIVPNDFNELQIAARELLNKESWWIEIPDHINYFNFDSLYSMLESMGFEVIYSQADFPMELFLLTGDDYVSNPDVGRKCHQKRVKFESNIDGELRRKIYRALAQVGIGRCCMVCGRLRGK